MHLLGDADEETRCIALGHDIVEDCDVTFAQLRELGFTERIIDGIRALTKIPGETYDEYKAKVKANPDAVRVKIADLTHNTDIRRLKGVAAKDMARMEKYFHFYMELVSLVNK
jgi:(p)ppGpp synthase/HD superfamily hydrolase